MIRPANTVGDVMRNMYELFKTANIEQKRDVVCHVWTLRNMVIKGCEATSPGAAPNPCCFQDAVGRLQDWLYHLRNFGFIDGSIWQIDREFGIKALLDMVAAAKDGSLESDSYQLYDLMSAALLEYATHAPADVKPVLIGIYGKEDIAWAWDNAQAAIMKRMGTS